MVEVKLSPEVRGRLWQDIYTLTLSNVNRRPDNIARAVATADHAVAVAEGYPVMRTVVMHYDMEHYAKGLANMVNNGV